MKRTGRINPFVVVGVVCFIILIPLFCASRKGPEAYAAEFLTALGKGDAGRLAELSIIGDHNLAEKSAMWQESVESSKYYTFTWRITDVTTISDDRAAVSIMMRRNMQIRMGEDEMPYKLPMTKTSDGWKVQIDQINREIYPYLPKL